MTARRGLVFSGIVQLWQSGRGGRARPRGRKRREGMAGQGCSGQTDIAASAMWVGR